MDYNTPISAGWSSLEARRAHNPKAAGSNPAPATHLFPRAMSQAAALARIFGLLLQGVDTPRPLGRGVFLLFYRKYRVTVKC